MAAIETYIGKKFGKLTIIGVSENRKYGQRMVWCQCDCGSTKEMHFPSIKSGDVKSCKCIFNNAKGVKNVRHALSNTRIFSTWVGMKQRCTNPKATGYKNYGGRGIRLCDEGLNDVAAFAKWAKENGYVEGLEIDRIDNDGNYEPSNCRFVTRQENLKNKSRKYSLKN